MSQDLPVYIPEDFALRLADFLEDRAGDDENEMHKRVFLASARKLREAVDPAPRTPLKGYRPPGAESR